MVVSNVRRRVLEDIGIALVLIEVLVINSACKSFNQQF